MISFYREGTDTNPYFPFDEDVVDWIIKEKEGASLRALNEAFSILLELADLESKSKIDMSVLNEFKSDVVGWKE